VSITASLAFHQTTVVRAWSIKTATNLRVEQGMANAINTFLITFTVTTAATTTVVTALQSATVWITGVLKGLNVTSSVSRVRVIRAGGDH
jgi:hypothetical protein